MLELNTGQQRSLHFEVNIQGVNYEELTGSLKFFIEDVEYGFPVKIMKDQISVNILPLDEIVAKGLRDGDVVECKLEVFGNGFYLNPWSGKFQLKTPVRMEAKVRLEDDMDLIVESPKKKPKDEEKNITATLSEESLFEDETDDNNYYEKLEKIVQQKHDVQPKQETKSKSPKSQKVHINEKTNKKVESKLNEMSSLVDSILGRKLKSKQTPTQTPKKKPVRRKQPKVIEEKLEYTDNDLVELMESVGMKSTRMQKIMLERVEGLADEPSAKYDILSKMLGLTKPDNFQMK